MEGVRERDAAEVEEIEIELDHRQSLAKRMEARQPFERDVEHRAEEEHDLVEHEGQLQLRPDCIELGRRCFDECGQPHNPVIRAGIGKLYGRACEQDGCSDQQTKGE